MAGRQAMSAFWTAAIAIGADGDEFAGGAASSETRSRGGKR